MWLIWFLHGSIRWTIQDGDTWVLLEEQSLTWNPKLRWNRRRWTFLRLPSCLLQLPIQLTGVRQFEFQWLEHVLGKLESIDIRHKMHMGIRLCIHHNTDILKFAFNVDSVESIIIPFSHASKVRIQSETHFESALQSTIHLSRTWAQPSAHRSAIATSRMNRQKFV